MDRDETKKIVFIIANSYPTFKPSDMSMLVDVWHEMLKEYDYNEVAVATKSVILSNNSSFAPSVGQIVNKLQGLKQTGEINELEAWDMVSRAIRDSLYHAEEHFEKFPEIVKKCVGSAGQLNQWARADSEATETVIQSNFIKTYRTQVARQKELQMLPSEAWLMIEQSNTRLLEG